MVVNSGTGACSAASNPTAKPTSAKSAMATIDLFFMLLSFLPQIDRRKRDDVYQCLIPLKVHPS
jgi:hypothetical protein